MRFRNRRQAGRVLAERLGHYAGRPDVVVLGLPRGGVPVAAEVARHLYAPLDVFLVRKLGVPGHEELAFGALAEGNVRVLHDEVVGPLGLTPDAIDRVAARERLELDRHEQLYRAGRPRPVVEKKTVIVVDDGLATGATMEASVVALRQLQPARIVVGAPVGARETVARLGRVADEVICAATPEPFSAVGLWYDDFGPTSDAEVIELLADGSRAGSPAAPHSRETR